MNSKLAVKTQNDIKADVRAKIIALINQQLADACDLSSQIKQAHWNVKGPSFIGLHLLFDEIYEKFEDLVDIMAERIPQLGGIVMGTVRVAASKSRLTEYPLDIVSGVDHVKALSNALATFAQSTRQASEDADKLDDADTADMFTQISRAIDTDLWKVEAHLQAKE